MRLTIGEIARCLHLSAKGAEDAVVTSVATDNRQIRPGGLFVCIPGSRVDGHDFAADAVRRGAVLVLAQKELPDIGAPVLRVCDTVQALGTIAALWRSRLKGKVIAVTGTCGKTTVKETLGQVLGSVAKTARTTLNHNNQIGMPVDLLNTDGDEDFLVMEVGISHEGDMDELGSTLKPDVALIVNVGAGHTEGLGKKGVAWNKARLLAHLAENGTGFVCQDYPDLQREAGNIGADVRYFSTQDDQCPIHGQYVREDASAGMGLFRLTVDGNTAQLPAPFHGEYGAENVVAVTACATYLGLGMEQVRNGLQHLELPPQRFRHLALGPWQIYDDTYNANPLSMRRMLHAVDALRGGRALVLVLGMMGELGDDAGELHRALGRDVAQVGPDLLFWKGDHAEDVRSGLGDVCPMLTVEDSAAFLTDWMEQQVQFPSGGHILFKGSRSNHLETLLDTFSQTVQGAESTSTGRAHVL